MPRCNAVGSKHPGHYCPVHGWKITETRLLWIVETDALEVPLNVPPPSRYRTGPSGEPLLDPPDTRTVTTRGFLDRWAHLHGDDAALD